MEDNIEMEKKYLIKEENIFKEIIKILSISSLDNISNSPHKINEYKVKQILTKERKYRYFDTFDRILEKEDLLAYVGPLEKEGGSASLRQREEDYVFTVKVPTEDNEIRKEYQTEIPAEGTDFYALSPEHFMHWSPMRTIKERGGNRSLQEVVRLLVTTNRFDLYSKDEIKIEIAVDQIRAESPLDISCNFYELEIEKKKYGNDLDKENIALFFTDNYGDSLIANWLPKWIKALKLMRGQKIE
ncbi:hypothetical protein HYU21_02885 [Candidatus Woesearchaeota archaeon]|nr:hypothetical protein [Candidatus Woesearchaeota archaeon]